MRVEYFEIKERIDLELGGYLPEVTIAYHTFGQLNEHKSNVIWVCHALTGSSNVLEWWDGLFGKGKLFDPRKYFIICANVISSHYGSTSPLSINPETEKPYYDTFPIVTTRDMVDMHERLRLHLGIKKIYLGAGGSLGGHQLLEWLIRVPDVFENAFLAATNHKHSPWGIAFNESQRMAIEADPTYGEARPDAGGQGLKAARSIALLSYRNPATYNNTQNDLTHDKVDEFKAASYQRYQGNKLFQRFNAYSYWRLTKAMDSFNVGRGKPSIEAALATITARCLVMGIDSDILFPPREQVVLASMIPNAQYVTIHSGYGHDGFLLEYPQMIAHIKRFLNL